MCKLSETSERWTSSGTSHDERIMTAIAIAKQSKGKMQSIGKNATRNFVNWLAPKLAITFRAHKCAMMTERADACFSGPRLCGYIELFEFCGSSAIKLTSLALKVQTTNVSKTSGGSETKPHV